MTQDFHRLVGLVVERPDEPLEALRASLAQEHRHRRSRERERARQGHLQLLAELSRQAAVTGAEGLP
jgi:phosphopantetheinyl transferase